MTPITLITKHIAETEISLRRARNRKGVTDKEIKDLLDKLCAYKQIARILVEYAKYSSRYKE